MEFIRKRLILFIVIFCFAVIGIAANKVYINPETSVVWKASGGDEVLDLGGLAQDAIDLGAYHDFGVAPRSEWYRWEIFIDGYDTAPTLGDPIELYFTMGTDTTHFAGEPSSGPNDTSEGTITTDQAKNCTLAGIAKAVSITAGDNIRKNGIVRLPLRYVAPVVHNNAASTSTLLTGGAHTITLTPVPPEIQP